MISWKENQTVTTEHVLEVREGRFCRPATEEDLSKAGFVSAKPTLEERLQASGLVAVAVERLAQLHAYEVEAIGIRGLMFMFPGDSSSRSLIDCVRELLDHCKRLEDSASG